MMQKGGERIYNKENRGVKVPEKIRSKELNLQAIKEAYNKLKEQKEEMNSKIKK